MNFFTDEKSKLLSDIGMKCCLEGDLEKGLKYFNTGLELDEDNIPLLYNKAGCLMSMGQSEKAKPIFGRVINLCNEMGKNEFSLQTKANSYLFLEDFETAKEVLEDLLKISPDNVDALSNVAQILRKYYHYEDALQYFDKALNIDPQNPELLMFKGETLFDLFRYEEAKECIDMSFDISKDNPYVWYLKGKYESERENYEQAVGYYDKAIELCPDFEKCYYNLVVALILLGRSEEAKKTFRKIFDLNPDKYEEWRVDLSDEIIDMLSEVFPCENA